MSLTPASPEGLPPLGEQIADEPFWRYPAGAGREGVAHLRVWLTTGPEPGHLAVVTQTGPAAHGNRVRRTHLGRARPQVRALARPARASPGTRDREGTETLDLVRVGADGSPHWPRVWPTPEHNPRHPGLELWMATDGYQIVSSGESLDWCEAG